MDLQELFFTCKIYSLKETRALYTGANTQLQLHLVNLRKGYNYVRKLRIISPVGMGSPFDSELLV